MEKNCITAVRLFLTNLLFLHINADYETCPFVRMQDSPMTGKYLSRNNIETVYSNNDLLLAENIILKLHFNEEQFNRRSKCAIPPETCRNETIHHYYRSIDGSCNNLQFPGFGMAKSRYGRLLPPKYSANSRPTTSIYGAPLPGARLLSLSLFGDDLLQDEYRTLASMQWGQIIAHDLSSQSVEGAPDDCCAHKNNEKCYPIELIPNGPIAMGSKKRCLSFSRALTDKDSMCQKKSSYEEKISKVTAFLDMSSIYGNSAEQSENIRQFIGGLLKTSFINNRQWLPVTNNSEGKCDKDNYECFHIPDSRNQFIPSITVMQTILLREHNRIACALSKLNPHYTDEQLYQEARKINIGQYQYIIYYEWLPVVLGSSYAYANGLIYNVKNGNYVNDYNDTVDPAPFVESAAAAFRYPHTQIPGYFSLVTSDRQINETKRLSDYFQKPSNIRFLTHGENFDSIIRGMLTQRQKRSDVNVDKEIKHYFNRKSTEEFGSDLKAIDINRGRDFGLPSYNDLRQYCGLPRAKDWIDFVSEIEIEKIESLQSLYVSPDDVDLTVGGALEKHLPDSLFGPTFQCILGKQFLNARISDRFFFENENPFGFSKEQLIEIRKTSMAKLFCNNGDYIQFIQPHAFIVPNPSNILRSCSLLPHVDLSKWKSRYF